MDEVSAATATAIVTADPTATADAVPQSASQPQVAETPTAPEPAAAKAEAAAPEPKPEGWTRERIAKLRAEDPDFQKAFSDHVNQDAQRRAAEMMRRQKLARAAEDPVAAQEFVQEEHAAIQKADEERAARLAPVTKAETEIAELSKNETWAAKYNELRDKQMPEFVKRWQADPTKFVDWADEMVTNALIEERATEKARTMTEAARLETEQKILKTVPVMPLGTEGGGARFTLEQIANMDSATFARNEEAINRQFGIGAKR